MQLVVMQLGRLLRKTPSRFLATRWVSITSKVCVEDMPTTVAVDATKEEFPSHSLPNHSGNPDCSAIKEAHQLLTANAASIDCNLGVFQNGYLGLIHLPKQYSRVSGTAFALLHDLGKMAQVPEWTLLTGEKCILRDHAEQRRLYDKYRTRSSTITTRQH